MRCDWTCHKVDREAAYVADFRDPSKGLIEEVDDIAIEVSLDECLKLWKGSRDAWDAWLLEAKEFSECPPIMLIVPLGHDIDPYVQLLSPRVVSDTVADHKSRGSYCMYD